jgi:glycerol-3-phosphate dehydrogenase
MKPASRAEKISQLESSPEFDLAIVGGGATGLGIALDASARGLKVVLLESRDFAKGTSSRSTKLLHGGVRYLAQGNISLVYEALHERSTVLHNAPHLSQRLAFVLPCYRYWEIPFYTTGLMLYDALAGHKGLGKTKCLGLAATRELMPNIHPEKLKASIQYWDAQFDDARLAIALARTAEQRGALLLNYCTVTDLIHHNGKISGLICQDNETGKTLKLRAGCVINSTGVWVDAMRRLDDLAQDESRSVPARQSQDIVAPSQGVHIVVDADFLPSHQALIIPKTSDGRVLFAVPWRGKVIIGTTDTPRHDLSTEPDPFKDELDFILRESARYLHRAPGRDDIRSIWVGLRPLVKPPSDDGTSTRKISREHTVLVSPSKLVTVTGGKWTTYRTMAQDAIEHCMKEGLVAQKAQAGTDDLLLVGAQTGAKFQEPLVNADGLSVYGDEAPLVRSIEGADNVLGGELTEAMVRFAARYEFARCVEDVLARRHRTLFLDARLAKSLANQVGKILLQETGIDPKIEDFEALCEHYLTLP